MSTTTPTGTAISTGSGTVGPVLSSTISTVVRLVLLEVGGTVMERIPVGENIVDGVTFDMMVEVELKELVVDTDTEVVLLNTVGGTSTGVGENNVEVVGVLVMRL